MVRPGRKVLKAWPLPSALALTAAALLFAQTAGARADDTAAGAFRDVTNSSGIRFRNFPPLFDPKIRHVNALWANFISSAAVGDFNGDGLDDIFFVASRQGQPNALYENTGRMTFRDVTKSSGLADLNDASNVCTFALWFDYGGDGRPDLFVGRFGRSLLFRNNGDGTFTDVTARSGLGVARRNLLSAVAFDYDSDSDLDLLVAGFFPDDADLFDLKSTRILPNDGHRAFNGGSKALYRNDGDGAFTDVTTAAGVRDTGFTTALGHADYDNDGRQDFYVANDFGPDRLYRNRGDGTFEDVTRRALGLDRKKGMNVDFGDFDNDGNLDIYVTNITEPWFRECNMLWLNMGDGMFVDVSRETGTCDTGWGWGAKFFDFDNDGLLDLYVANGFISAGRENYAETVEGWQRAVEKDQTLDLSDARLWPAVGGRTFAGYERNRLFRNAGGELFHEVGKAAGVDSILDGRGVAVSDFDNDGAVDVLLTNSDAPPVLYRNTARRAGNWVEFTLKGARGNRSAVGARVRIVAAGRAQIREVNCGNGYQSQSSFRVHFGLGAAAKVDLVEVRWPGGGFETYPGVAANRVVELSESFRP
ncbi:MAG TPA: CRTAC1 family protein [Pyrinomonadaceae bacterium]|nr:CRTAC1 family protein [Pyrinomonadaceae bacterium]